MPLLWAKGEHYHFLDNMRDTKIISSQDLLQHQQLMGFLNPLTCTLLCFPGRIVILKLTKEEERVQETSGNIKSPGKTGNAPWCLSFLLALENLAYWPEMICIKLLLKYNDHLRGFFLKYKQCNKSSCFVVYSFFIVLSYCADKENRVFKYCDVVHSIRCCREVFLKDIYLQICLSFQKSRLHRVLNVE